MIRYRRCKTSISYGHSILKSSISESTVTLDIEGPTLDIGVARPGIQMYGCDFEFKFQVSSSRSSLVASLSGGSAPAGPGPQAAAASHWHGLGPGLGGSPTSSSSSSCPAAPWLGWGPAAARLTPGRCWARA
jgi:hypothetical protein